MGAGSLTVAEVAAELEMTNDGVYKLIKRGKLEGVRRSERGLRVPQAALAGYQRRLVDHPHTVSIELTSSPHARATPVTVRDELAIEPPFSAPLAARRSGLGLRSRHSTKQHGDGECVCRLD
jgi:excisionase family DNA binding protein